MQNDNMSNYFSFPKGLSAKSKMSTDTNMTTAQMRYAKMEKSADVIDKKEVNNMSATKSVSYFDQMKMNLKKIAQERNEKANIADRMAEKIEISDLENKAILPLAQSKMSFQYTLKNMLMQNIGEYVVIEYYVGKDMLVKKQGILYNVESSYVILFDEKNQNFVMTDLSSIKFVTFYSSDQKPE